MGKGAKRKPLEAWQLEDARRLRELWDAKKPMSQEKFAQDYLDATQGAFFQYVDGRIPLNLDAAMKFAAGLGVKISAISPTLAAKIIAAAALETPTESALLADEHALLERYRAADPRWQLSLMLIAWTATENQNSVAESANVIMSKIFRKDPSEIKPVSSRKVRKAYGDVPRVAARKARAKTKEKIPE